MLLVDRHSHPMRFVQLWTSAQTGRPVRRQGTVGRSAPVVELPRGTVDASADLVGQGYEVFPDGGWARLVVQWPMRSLTGSVQDRGLLDRAAQWIEAHLDERGLGYLDGHDRGRRISAHGGFVQNLFFDVVDGPLASTAAMTCLRGARLDATRASIAHRPDSDAPWTVRYHRTSNKIPGDFTL